jgi:hypothetical protein
MSGCRYKWLHRESEEVDFLGWSGYLAVKEAMLPVGYLFHEICVKVVDAMVPLEDNGFALRRIPHAVSLCSLQ